MEPGRGHADQHISRRDTPPVDQALPIAKAGAPRPLVANCDVTRDGDVERAVTESVRHWGTLDVVVANAGFGVVGPFDTLSLEDYRRQFEINVFGVLRTIYAALPQIEHSRGHVVIFGSVAGWTSTTSTCRPPTQPATSTGPRSTV